jgi:hypothetical protein
VRLKNIRLEVISLLIAYYLSLVVMPAYAQTMSNQDYIVQSQGFNPILNAPETSVANSDKTVLQGVNFKIRTGFESLTTTTPFSIGLSSDLVDFGALTPTNPVIRTIDLNINSLSTYGYSVLVFENNPLTSANKAFIPDTTCDNGDCGIETAALWTNSLTYGLGYRCDNLIGSDCDSVFANPNFYKHFPDLASNDDVVSIMAGAGADNKSARISYKVNISGMQAQGSYNNTVTYLAVPNY